MTPEQAARLESSEYQAFADLCQACPPPMAGAIGLIAGPVAGSLAISAPGIPTREFNRGALLPGADLPALLAHLRRARQGMLQLAEPLATDDLRAWLAALGCAPAPQNWIMLTRGPGEPALPETGLLTRALGPDDAPAAGQVFAAGYGMPPPFAPWIAALVTRPHWRAFGSFAGDRLIGVGFLYQRGPEAIMLGAATLAEARGQGAQTALLALRIREASRAGARLLQSHTGLPAPGDASPSLNNMRAAGFRDAFLRLNYLI